MERVNYQNVIIGFGKGGKTLAKFLATQGESVALIEQSAKMYGGTCINIGCIPSKSLIVNGKRHMPFAEAAQKKLALVGKLNQKNYQMIANEQTATVIDGTARFISNTEIEVSENGTVIKTVVGERIFINTGSIPVIPPIKGLDTCKNAITSTELLDVTDMPESLVIIGAGYISLEFASMFQQYGTRVTVLNRSDRFLPNEDPDIAERIFQDMTESGIEFHLGVGFNELGDLDGRAQLAFTSKAGEQVTITADKVLLATGRKPNTQGLGLENTSVELTDSGAVKVNSRLQTTAPGIWAIGDVHGGQQFTYTSLDDFRIIKSQLFGDGSKDLDTRGVVPNSVFINPTLSTVGINEKAAQQMGIDYKLYRLEASAIPKSLVLSQTKGLLKALVDTQTEQILGAALYCEDSHEVINLVALAVRLKTPYTVLRDQIYTHPTISEALNDLFA